MGDQTQQGRPHDIVGKQELCYYVRSLPSTHLVTHYYLCRDFQDACEEWTLHTGIRFRRLEEEGGEECDFIVRQANEDEEEENPSTICESFFFSTPHKKVVKVWLGIVLWVPYAVFLHTVGHILGFRHEHCHQKLDNQIHTVDQESIMSFAYLSRFRFSGEVGAQLSTRDCLKASELYPTREVQPPKAVKRTLEDDVVLVIVELPDDVWLSIARWTNWYISGLLARLNKTMLRVFTSRDAMREIIHSIHKGDGILFKWLLLSLPRALLWGEALTLSQPLCLSDPLVFTVPAFVTGGALCQIMYDKVWDSDIDIFVNYVVGSERRQLEHEGRSFDLIPMSKVGSERCIEFFDLSILQQGYQLQEEGEFYCTPLALYTAMWREIIVIPTAECIDYTVPGLGARVSNACIWRYIDRHTKECEEGTLYHRCKECDDRANAGRGECRFRRWRARAQKYSLRFPDFSFIYCKPPPSQVRPFDYSPLVIEREPRFFVSGRAHTFV